MAWQNRIIGEDMEAPDQLLASAMNWRIHPRAQKDALAGVLDQVGFVQRIIVNARSNTLIDGHLRVNLALERGEPKVPVIYVDLSEAEEKLVLATLDPLSAMAARDDEKLQTLLGDIAADDPGLRALLDDLAQGGSGGAGGDEAGDPQTDPEAALQSLAERFLIPPFSVFDARQGYWQDRKGAWIALGIEGGRGRGSHLTYAREGDIDPVGLRIQDAGPLTSIFDPVLAEIAYTWFSPPGGRVLDPFAGGSVRGIVAAKLGRKYTGIDLSQVQITANHEQALKTGILEHLAYPPLWVQGDSANLPSFIRPTDCLDFLFTCPPYFDLERYSDNPADLSAMVWDDFVHVYYRVIEHCAAALAPDRFAVWVIGDVRDKAGIYRDLAGHTIEAFERAGMALYNEAILLTALGSLPLRVGRAFTDYRKLGRAHQTVLVFVKGDPKKAAAACGPVEIAGLAENAPETASA